MARGAFAALVALCSLSAAAAVPWFCHSNPCPAFVSEEQHSGWEKRLYPADAWVSTQVVGVEYSGAVTTGFKVRRRPALHALAGTACAVCVVWRGAQYAGACVGLTPTPRPPLPASISPPLSTPRPSRQPLISL